MRYIQVMKNPEDGTVYTPKNPASDNMEYIDHQWVLTHDGVINLLNIDLQKKMDELDEKQFLKEISDEVYSEMRANSNHGAFDVLEFKAAMTPAGREAIERIMKAQVKYAVRTGNDMKEHTGLILSEYAIKEARNASVNLFYKGRFNYGVERNPDPELREFPYTAKDNGYRNLY